jgi:hypothetical protein
MRARHKGRVHLPVAVGQSTHKATGSAVNKVLQRWLQRCKR